MSGSHIKAVVDINVLYISVYDKEGKAGRIILAAMNNKIKLFSPDLVKEELTRVLKRELKATDEEAEFIIEKLPVTWIEKEIYGSALEKTIVKKKGDKTVEALALILNCGILTADTDFDKVKQKIDVNELLKQLEESDNR